MNKTAKILGAAAVVAAVAVPVYLLAPGRATKRQKTPFMGVNFAHRGLHSRDKSVPENSLPAFELAAAAGYGIELDVQLSKDGHLVVFHDDTLDRVCGVSARVDELDLHELQQLRLCGSEYSIPLLSEVLKTVRGRSPLIVELKTGRRNKELCRKVYAALSDYSGNACVESFDPTIVSWFRFHGRDVLRGQLAQPAYRYPQKKALSFVLSRGLMNFLARPQFMAYRIGKKPLSVKFAEWLGAMKVAWTSHEPLNEKGNDAVIFEFYKPRVKYK